MRVSVSLLFLAMFVLVSSLIPKGHRLSVEGWQRRMTTFVEMASKNNKKKKKEGGSSSDSLPSSSSPAVVAAKPVRVTSNTNIPVRQQIAWAKAYKRLVSSNGFNKKDETRKFRQQSKPKEAEEEYVEIDYKNVKPPALFVDGYNIIGYLNAVEGRSISFDEARDCLIADLSVLCGATGWFVEVIFDAYKVASPQSTQTIDSLLVTYTSMAETADNYIERRFTELSNSGYNNMVVATDDRVLRMAAGSLGVGYLTAGMLVEEFRIAYRGWENMEEDMQRVAKQMRPNLGDSLSEEMRDALITLKAEAVKQREAAKLQTELEAAWAYKEQEQEQEQEENDSESGTNEGKDRIVMEKSRGKVISNSSISTMARTKGAIESVSSGTTSSSTLPVESLPTAGTDGNNNNNSSGKKFKRGKHNDDDVYLSNRKADIEGFARHKIGKRPTIGDGISDQMKAIIEQMKKEAEEKEAKV